MDLYQWPEGCDIISMTVKRNSTGRPEAIISLAQRPGARMSDLPAGLRKKGMTAVPAVASGKLALRVQGFPNTRQLLESIAAIGFGSPLPHMHHSPAVAASATPTVPWGQKG